MWRIEFESEKFLPFLPKECQGNPGVYGFELASWLCLALARRGVVTSYPLGEDWGWLLEHLDEERLVGCSSVCNEGDGYNSASITWSIFVDSRNSARRKQIASVNDAEQALATHITAVLEAESISWELV
jgi:hypothetical protein